MILISCDPSTKKCAFAIYKNFKLVEYFAIQASKKENIMSKKQQILNVFEKYSGDFMLAIEDQYGHLNTKTLIKLVESRMFIQMLADVYKCLGFYIVPPSTWQKHMFGKGKMLRDERKEKAKKIATSMVNEQINDSDIADAICIGQYVLKNYQSLEVISY